MRKSVLFFAVTIGFLSSLHAQVNLSGKVVDPNGSPIFGANVGILNTYRGTSTNIDGTFSIKNIQVNPCTLKVSFIGYKSMSQVIDSNARDEITINLNPNTIMTDEFTVSATRANDKTPIAYVDMDKEEIEKRNNGQDLPYMIKLTPSVVTTSDAGAGVGYTGIRIRGSDASRINVTINGIPINDPESQGVWWVNMPDLASSASSIQIQRGVGTSTNGAGAFGGSVNIQTNDLKTDPYGELNLSGGSFGTLKSNAAFGTGLLNDHWSVDGRLSQITSDGYIDRASSDLQSYYFSGGFQGKRQSIRLVTFGGKEKTYQAWNGVPSRYLANNRTFNPYDYKNEIDNYSQQHFQLLTNWQLSDNLNLSVNGHYTKGAGYFEQYKGDQFNALLNYGSKANLSDYGMGPYYIGGDTITSANLIRRKWLDNDFYGAVFSLNYNSGKKLNATLGGAANQYLGKHYGEVIWSEYAVGSNLGDRYYENDATKNEFNIYGKANYQLNSQWNLFGDLQFRQVYYQFEGLDTLGNPETQAVELPFVNPKAGVSYSFKEKNTLYASLAVGNREPNRTDYTQNNSKNQPQSEQMIDYELGYTYAGNKLRFNSNAYYMNYTNQLILTGQLDDVGDPKRINVPLSYRAGIELTAGWRISPLFDWTGNLTYSQNKIKEFTAYVDDWSTGLQQAVVYQNTNIAYSPDVIASQELVMHVLKDKGNRLKSDLDIAFVGKHIGKQFIDNTSNAHRQLDEYTVFDLRVDYRIRTSFLKELGLYANVQNLLATEYVSNAWSYAFSSPGYDPTPDDPYVNSEGGDNYNMIGNFPNAKRYFILGLRLKI